MHGNDSDIEPEDADLITALIYEDAEARSRSCSTFKVTGHAPDMGQKMWQIFFDILQEGPKLDW